MYLFDKERSSRITTLGVGGDFYDLAADDSPLAFQPFARIDEEAERNWAIEWVQALLKHEVKTATFMTPDKKAALWNALLRLGAFATERSHHHGAQDLRPRQGHQGRALALYR